MTTILAAPEPIQPLYLWTREKYERAIAQGVFGPDDHIELIEGVIVPKMPQNDPHRSAVGAMQEALGKIFQDGYWLCIQMPLAVGGRSMPEPDLAVVVGTWRDYRGGAPTAEKTVLVVEVSDSSLVKDRTEKALMYARAGVQDYWIVNLSARTLEVRRGPSSEGYQEALIFTEADAVAPLAAGDTPIAMADLLP